MANQNLFQNYLTRPKSVDEYGQASANRELTEQRVLGARDANALQSLTMQQTRETMADATKKRNALRDIIQGLGPDAPPEKVIQALKSNPYTIDAGVALEKHIADVANTTATASNTTATAAKTNEAVRMEKIANHARGLELVKTPQDVVAFFQDGINTGALQGSVNEHLKQADQFDTLDAWKAAYRKAVVSEETKFKEGADTTRAAATSAASTGNANIAAASRLAPAGLQLDASGKAVVNPELMKSATALRAVGPTIAAASRDKIAETKAKVEAASLLGPEDTKLMADQYLDGGDKSVLVGLGRGAQSARNIVNVRKAIREGAIARGLSGADIAAKLAEYGGILSAQRTVGTRSANIEVAGAALESQLPIAKAASEEVSRSGLLPFGKAQIMFDEQTNDVPLRRLAAANNAVINTYSRAINPTGVGSVHDKQHAREILLTAFDHESYVAVLEQMAREINAEREGIKQARGTFTNTLSGTAKATSPTSSDLPAGWTVKVK